LGHSFRRKLPTDITDENHTSRSARLSEALLPTELQAAQFPTVISIGITDGSKTKDSIIEIFGVHFNLFPSELPTEINATDNIYVPLVILMEILAYKTIPPPPFGSFFLLALISISSPLRLSLVFGRDLIVLVVVFNILKGM
jgi:hypothetical protein